jgi:hypothetical protein
MASICPVQLRLRAANSASCRPGSARKPVSLSSRDAQVITAQPQLQDVLLVILAARCFLGHLFQQHFLFPVAQPVEDAELAVDGFQAGDEFALRHAP